MRSSLLGYSVFCSLVVGCTPSSAPPPSAAPSPTSPPAGAPAIETPSSVAGSSSGGSAGDVPQERMCGGIAGLRCPEKQYCAYAPEARCGAADMSGTCAPIPDMCTQQLDEVCGCDDKTYGNACTAAQAGVSVVMKGACAPAAAQAGSIAEGKLCGTRGVPGECATGLYCAFKSDCGATDRGGTCRKKASICTKIYKPVCGCDDKTYGSDCTAAAAGVSVKSPGECAKK